MSKKEQVEQLTNYMANFVDHIGKVLPDDIIKKLDETCDAFNKEREYNVLCMTTKEIKQCGTNSGT